MVKFQASLTSGVLCLLYVLLCVPLLSSAQPSGGIIGGRIHDASTKAPVAGATVAMVPVGDRRTTRRALTNTLGEFRFEDVSPGRFLIQVTKPGYSPAAFGQRVPGDPDSFIDLRPGERLDSLTIPLWKRAVVAGRIWTDRGEAVHGIVVSALSRTVVGGREHFRTVKRAKTDEKGAYRISDLNPGQYVLAAGAKDTSDDGRIHVTTFYPSSAVVQTATRLDFPAGAELTALDIIMIASASVRVAGVIRKPDGHGARLSVSLIAPPDDQVTSDADVMSVETSPEGQFAFPRVPPGDYIIRAVEVQHRIGSALLAGRTVVIPKRNEAPARNTERARDDSSPATWWAELPIRVGRENISDFAIELQSGFHLSGRVLFEGDKPPPAEAISALQLYIYPIDGRQLLDLPSCELDSEGRFRTVEVPPGRYAFGLLRGIPGWSVRSIQYQGMDLAGRSFALTSSMQDIGVIFSDQVTSMAGVATAGRQANGRDRYILIFPAEPALRGESGLTTMSRLKLVKTGSDGAFSVSLPPGSYSVVATQDSPPPQWELPAYLNRLSTLATTVLLRPGETTIRNMPVRELPKRP